MLRAVFTRALRHCGTGQRGAALLEMSIALPFLLVFILSGLDISYALSEHLIVREAHYAAARAGALQTSDCAQFAESDFVRRLQKLGLANRIQSVQATNALLDFIDVSGTQVPVHGLNLEVAVRSRCVVCRALSLFSADFNYNSGSFFPFENTTDLNPSCTNTTP